MVDNGYLEIRNVDMEVKCDGYVGSGYDDWFIR